MVSKAQIVKWGNSLAVRIPKAVADEADFKEGDSVALEVTAVGLTVKAEKRPPTLQELVAQITPQNLHSEVWSDDPRGREIW